MVVLVPHPDELVYLCGKHIVCVDLMKKKQTFMTRRKEDGDITAMTTYYGSKGNSGPINLVAVGLKSSQSELPTVVVHDKNDFSVIPIVLSHLSLNMNVINLTFLSKGKFLAILVEMEPGVRYNVSVWTCQSKNPAMKIFDEMLDGHWKKIECCLVENTIFAVIGDSAVKVYGFKGENVSISQDRTETVNKSLILTSDEHIVDACWLKSENKLVIATNLGCFVFEGCVFEEYILFEFPPNEFKQIIREKGIKGEEELQESIDWLVTQVGITTTMTPRDFDTKPRYLNKAFEEFGRKHAISTSLERMTGADQRKAVREVYSNMCLEVMKRKKISVNCVCRQEVGFAIGFKGLGMVAIYRKKKDVSYFQIDSVSFIKDREVDTICSLTSSYNDNQIATTVKLRSKFGNFSDVMYDSLGKETSDGSLEIVIFNSNLVNSIKNASVEPFDFLYPHSTHSQGVTDVALTPSKSLAVTVSKDKTLKFWTYSGDQRQVFSYDLSNFETSKHEIVFDVHPLGHQIAVGSTKGLRIYFLVEGDLVVGFENREKPCLTVQYSSRGHLLAVGQSTEVKLYDPYSFELVHAINSSEPRTMSWVGRDRYLVRLCNNSNLNVYDTWNNYNSVYDDTMISWSGIKIHDCAYDPEFELLVCCCSDNFARIYSKGMIDPFALFEAGEGVIFTTVLISKKLQVVIFGTNTGAVRIYLWPPIKIDRVFLPRQMQVHGGPVTSLKITPNFEYLVTCSEDCSVYFLKITEYQKGVAVTANDAINGIGDQKDAEFINRISNAFALNEFSFLTNSIQKDMLKRMGELESELQNKITEIDEENEKMTLEHNRELNAKDKKNVEETHKMNIDLTSKMDKEGGKLKMLELQCKELNNKLKEVIKEKEENHRRQLMALYAERDQIELEKNQFVGDKEKALRDANDRFTKNLEIMQSEFERNKQQINKDYAKAIFYLKEDQKKFQVALKQTEDEYTEMITTVNTNLTTQLKKKKEMTEVIRTKTSKLKKDNEKNRDRLTNLDKLITETKEQNKQLMNDIKAFKQKYEEMEKRLNQQEDVINYKESKIKEYRNKNYHLQNFKSVYDYQVTTLKEAHEPLSEYVDNLEVGAANNRNTSRRCTTSCCPRPRAPRHWKTTSRSWRTRFASCRTTSRVARATRA